MPSLSLGRREGRFLYLEGVSSGRESFGGGEHRVVSLLSWPSETGDGSRAFANVQHPVTSGDSAWPGHSADLGLSLAGNPDFWKVGHCAHRGKIEGQLVLSLGKGKSWAPCVGEWLWLHRWDLEAVRSIKAHHK